MLKINELARLYLGVKEENLSRTIEIDMSAWAGIYPNATADILHKRSGDQTKYLTGATYDSDTKILSWTPTAYDTFYEGFGIAEIRMMEGEVVKKTKDLLVTAVSPSLIDGTGEVIASDYQAWLDTVLGYKQAAAAAQDAAEDAQAAAEDAQDAAEDAQDAAEAAITKWPKISEGNGNWLVWDAEQGEYVDTGVHAQGPQGEPGTIENVRATGIKMSILDETTVYDAINARADKVNSATSGNFAALDENGNLTDSGHKHSDYLTSHQDISGKADKVSSPTSGDFAGLDENGNLTDSGKKASDFAPASDLYGNKIPMSSSDSTKVSSNISANQESIQNLRKGMVLVAKLTSGNWQLNSGVNAAIGDYISVNGIVGRATAAIVGGTTNIVENTNWVKLPEGAVNELVGNIGTISTNLGDPSSASGVTGSNAFSKISTLNSNLGSFKFTTLGSISSNGSITKTVANTTRAVVFLIGSNASRMEIILIFSSTTGSITATKVIDSSYITVDTSNTNQITIGNNTSSSTDVYIMIFAGSVS
ncbi:MAG: hypothetical protein J6Y48_06610 [Clostridia bacterium]|nr:hypothetical protein [Clostridia bacterium]